MLDQNKVLAMIKTAAAGENPRKSLVLQRWMTVPETPKHRSILAAIERRFASQPEPSDEELVQAVEAYVKV